MDVPQVLMQERVFYDVDNIYVKSWITIIEEYKLACSL